MQDLLKSGQVLGREELKKIMAGSGCMDTCIDIAHACTAASTAAQGAYNSICTRQFECCAGMCMNWGC